jgi:heme-degrading monooxygenase HmoA
MLKKEIAFTTYIWYLHMPDIRYSKHNRVRFKSLEEKEEGTKMFSEFFDILRKEELGKKMRGHIILNSTNDFQESIVLTFWETREDMDTFYSMHNKALTNLVERAKSLFEKMPERTDYDVSELSFVIS